ncbi:hypothetical protein [Crocosphaera sp.]|uniref:hypothetical protein n=1 Tax=Crocosphaera sp. TaxID=2729996 RepID=UPI0026374CCA|nr:hypothetical protein [Crocosphaera sp.]MDJ0579594.1 hypothetical protein [Crocosphaera sp.]
MNKIFSLLVLVPTFFCGINNLSTKAEIPQGSFQQIYIEGDFNQVTQQLNQNLNLHFINVPDFEMAVIPNFNIQGEFLDNTNNEVTQGINQLVFNSHLMPLISTDLTIKNFLGDDNILNGVQFNEQRAFIKGNANITAQVSNQNITDFFLLELSDNATDSNDVSQFLDELLESKLLDSFQFSSQDSLLFGDNNIIDQSITQTFDIFIFSNTNSNTSFEINIWREENLLMPTQLTIQETFINFSKNNYIIQSINQSIDNISFLEFDSVTQNYLLPSFLNTNIDSNNLDEFPIDIFINEILNNTIIDSQQINRQFLEVIGNNNKKSQENEQILELISNEKLLELTELTELTINEQQLSVSIPEPSNLKMLLVLSVLLTLLSVKSQPKS